MKYKTCIKNEETATGVQYTATGVQYTAGVPPIGGPGLSTSTAAEFFTDRSELEKAEDRYFVAQAAYRKQKEIYESRVAELDFIGFTKGADGLIGHLFENLEDCEGTLEGKIGDFEIHINEDHDIWVDSDKLPGLTPLPELRKLHYVLGKLINVIGRDPDDSVGPQGPKGVSAIDNRLRILVLPINPRGSFSSSAADVVVGPSSFAARHGESRAEVAGILRATADRLDANC